MFTYVNRGQDGSGPYFPRVSRVGNCGKRRLSGWAKDGKTVPMKNVLGVRLRRMRLQAGLSIEELAARVGIPKAYMQRLEDGATNTPPSEMVLTRLATILEDVPDVLFCYARRIPTDVSELVLDNPLWLSVLRTAKLKNISPFSVLSFCVRYAEEGPGSLEAGRPNVRLKSLPPPIPDSLRVTKVTEDK